MSERCDEYWRLYVRWRRMQAAAMEADEGGRSETALSANYEAYKLRLKIDEHYDTCPMCRAWLEEVKE